MKINEEECSLQHNSETETWFLLQLSKSFLNKHDGCYCNYRLQPVSLLPFFSPALCFYDNCLFSGFFPTPFCPFLPPTNIFSLSPLSVVTLTFFSLSLSTHALSLSLYLLFFLFLFPASLISRLGLVYFWNQREKEEKKISFTSSATAWTINM